MQRDCDRCAALCCVAYSFEQSDEFAFTKEAHVPCKHLRGHACSIHARLREEGMHGCAQYDCLGAGQRASAQFAGAHTREALDAFVAMKKEHEALVRITRVVSRHVVRRPRG
jgi:hypothetical protein